MAARVVLKLPSSSPAPANAHGRGRPCGALSMPPSRRAPPPAVARAVANSSPGAAENTASMQNLLGLLNGTAGQRDARETRTKKQLQKPKQQKHPKNIHNQLSMVDALEKIGISRHYPAEIKSILDATYSCWLQRDDEIMLDTETCAMAFRILRMSGYDVSSDDLSHIAEALSDLHAIRSLLELYKASQVSISEDELILDSIGTWSGRLLEEQLSSSASQRTPLLREVEHALSSPFYTTLDRLEHKRNMEQPDAMEHLMLHCLPWQMNQDLLALGVMDFTASQSIYQQELELLDSWEKHEQTEYYSEQVEIVFSAIYNSVNQLGAKASMVQGRDVTGHLVEIWQDLLRNIMTEAEWRESGYVPTQEEYMENAVVTFALGPIVLPALYFVGPKIMESVITDAEYIELFRLMSTCGRLLNDVQTYEREYTEGKLNSVSLLVLHSVGSLTIQEARRELQKPIDTCKRDLLRLVLREDSVVPRPCKELFWNMCKTCYFFYSQGDAFSSPEEKVGAVNAVIHEPLQLPCSIRSCTMQGA